MKLAVLVWEYPPRIVGGLGTYSAEITRQFVLMGNDVTVFTMNDDANSLPTHQIWHGIEIHRPQNVDISQSLPDLVAEDIKGWGSGLQWFSKILMYNYLSASKLVNELIRKEGEKFGIIVAHDWLSAIG
jgi:glycogen(starch) synthase